MTYKQLLKQLKEMNKAELRCPVKITDEDGVVFDVQDQMCFDELEHFSKDQWFIVING